jgi:hypothetical protein
MPKFEFRGLEEGDIEVIVIEAENETEAMRKLLIQANVEMKEVKE